MLKKVILKIHSHIDNLDSHGFPEGDAEISDTVHNGAMKIFRDEISLSYQESTESGKIFCDIFAIGNKITVSRKGAIVSTMVFDTDNEYKTVYELPPYKFDMTLTTKRVRQNISAAGGTLDILYDMEVGGAKKRTRMKIEVAEVAPR